MNRIVNIGSRRELFVDDFLIHTTTARLALQKPVRKGTCFVFDGPYEGTCKFYPVLMKDGGVFRIYYTQYFDTNADATEIYLTEEERKLHPFYCCCIESNDGIHWVRPSLGLIDHAGSRDNNIVFHWPDLDDFIPLLDTNPDCKPDEKYKAFRGDFRGDWKQKGKLFAYKSPDGYRWTPISDEPIMSGLAFDSSNLAFWDESRQKYRAYVRHYHAADYTVLPGDNWPKNPIRDIRWCESADFIHWSVPELLDFGGSPDIPLYISAVTQYYRAPHLFLGFPVRYVEKEAWSPSFDQLPDPGHRRNRMKHNPRFGLAITDCAFMSSRDGRKWNRTDEAFLRPGIVSGDNWVYGDCYLSIGMQETVADQKGAPNELSMYTIENQWKGVHELVRYTLRQDGFMALSADGKGCDTVTKPLVFGGGRLTLNVSTSAAGGMRVEIQDVRGEAIQGYALADCDDIFGDRLDYTVSWNGCGDVSSLAGKAVRLRFHMNDADLFSIKFE